jgi:hypothetical protein
VSFSELENDTLNQAELNEIKINELSKFKYFCFVAILDMSLISRSCKNYHIIFNVGTPSLEARNIRLVNIITYIIEESKLISENMSPNVIHC